MVAAAYAEKHSTLAKSIGLGRKPNSAVAAEAAETTPEEEQVTPIPKTQGRKLAKAVAAHEE